jgi:GntR family carbon starvation induced transcriptional regulator
MSETAAASRSFQPAHALPTRTQLVDERLRQAILSGELAPGEKIRPAELAARFGVSATPLREAVLRLEADGLVESIPQRGSRVTELSRDSLNQIYEIRLVLEPLALRKAMAAQEDVDVERIKAAHTAMNEAFKQPDLVLRERLHREFHRSLFEACGSAWLLSITDNLSIHSARYRLLSLEPRGGAKAVEKEHADLVTAFMSRDADAAVDQLVAHISRTLDFIPLLPETES